MVVMAMSVVRIVAVLIGQGEGRRRTRADQPDDQRVDGELSAGRQCLLTLASELRLPLVLGGPDDFAIAEARRERDPLAVGDRVHDAVRVRMEATDVAPLEQAFGAVDTV